MSTYTIERLIGLGLIWAAIATAVVTGIYRLGQRRPTITNPPRRDWRDMLSDEARDRADIALWDRECQP